MRDDEPLSRLRSSLSGLWQLFMADYRRLYSPREDGGGPASRALIRLFTNPSLRAIVALRLANASPPASTWLWRSILLGRYRIDWSGRGEYGPGLSLPHPLGIAIAPRVKIGRNVLVCHNVSIGGDIHGRAPVIEDDVLIYPGAVIIGGVTIGEGSVIGANSFVNRDVPPRTVVKRDVMEPLRPPAPSPGP